ncbi:LamG domain-containing protein [Ideonella sp. DXS22W]|uniref:LamG domain-containing protein n=1 Tax=Pseudaquabacterium inlustre TaxID=2984192 RepID=A0ABU9CC03_9BURK
MCKLLSRPDPASGRLRAWLAALFVLALLAASPRAWAAAYSFPGALPAGCSGSNGSYSCTNLTLGYGDTVTIGSPKPATITVSGNLSTANARINASGSASDLTLVVNGQLLLQYQAVLVANVTAGSINDETGSASVTGHLSATGTGPLTLRWNTTVSGDLSTGSGTLTLMESNTIAGSLSSTSGAVNIGYRSAISGNVSSGGAISVGQEVTVNGSVTGGNGSVTVGYAARVTSNVTTNAGAILLANLAQVNACVKSTASASITLDYQSVAAGVCCGSGTCGQACVANNSTYAMPPACSTAVTPTYANASTPYAWIDASSHTKIGTSTTPYRFNGGNGCGTTPPTLDDTISDPIPIGFSFSFQATTYTSVRVMTNGRVQFGSTTTCGYGTANAGPPQDYGYQLPDSGLNTTMKVFGADLDPTNLAEKPDYPSASSRTSCTSLANCYVSVATIGTAPQRKFVVTWYHVPEWVSASNTSGSFDVQLILNENGTFVYQYGTISHGGTGTAEVGWQISSTDYDVIEFGAASEPPPNSALVFYVASPVLAWYQAEEGAWSAGGSGQVRDSSGNGLHGTPLGQVQVNASGKICRGASIPLDTTAAGVNALRLGATFASGGSQTLAGTGAVMFWIKANTAWQGVRDAQLVDAATASGEWFHLVRLASGVLRFAVTDSTGVVRSVDTPAQTFAASTWQHLAIVWNFNGSPTANSDSLAIYVNGTRVAYTTFTSDGSLPASLGALHIGDNPSGYTGQGGTVNSADAVIDEVQVLNYVPTNAQVTARMNDTHACDTFGYDHLELRHASWSGVACSPATLTVVACAHSTVPCTSYYTKGAVITLTNSTGSAYWLSGNDATVTLGWGQSSASKDVYVGTGTALLGVGSASPAPTNVARCNGTAGSCLWTSNASGLLLDASAITGGKPQAFTVQAVESVGASPPQACRAIQGLGSGALKLWATPVLPLAFAGTSTSAGVTVGGTPQVATAQGGPYTALGTAMPASATLSGLSFDANAGTPLWLKHMDSHRFTLSARLSTTAPPLTLDGSALVTALPVGLGVTVPAARQASAAVQTACAAGPSSGCDSTGGAAARTGAAGDSFSSTVLAALWTSDTDTDLSDNPVAPSVTAAATLSPVLLAPQGGSAGVLGSVAATLTGGSSGAQTQSWSQSGVMRIGASASWLGSSLSGQSAAIGRFSPHHFRTVASVPGCGTFTYSGQPITTVAVSAMDGAAVPTPTANYRGAFARTVTLSDSSGAAGSFSANTIAAGGFTLGLASASPVFTFTSALTAPATLSLRASDGEASSAGITGAEASAPVRSGRLRLSNAFGQARAPLQVPLSADYWSGAAWVVNNLDSCTLVPAASISLTNPRDARGEPSAATSSATAVSLVAGRGLLVLTAPSPAGSSLTLDIGINLGSGNQDNGCLAVHAGTTGAARPWLRSRNGSCSTTWDRDPSARASFGIHSPETRRNVHVRDVF